MPEAASLAELLKSRRTIHAFRADPPPRELVYRALEAARWAPNHHRTEPWRFLLPGPETARGIAMLNAALVRARSGDAAADAKLRRWLEMPGWLVVTVPRDADPVREREDYAAGCCALHNFALALWEQGLGTKWSTGKVTRDPRFFALLGLDPQAVQCVGLVWFGYPVEIPAQTRLPLADCVRELP